MILGMFIGLLWFLLFVLGHAATLRLLAKEARAHATSIICLVCLAAIPAALWPLITVVQKPVLVQGGWAPATLCGLLTFGGLFIIYMPFYYVVIASLSVRTLVLLAGRPDSALPLAALRQQFASGRLVDQRLAAMAQNGFLAGGPDGYALTSKGKLVGLLFSFIKRVWRLGPGG